MIDKCVVVRTGFEEEERERVYNSLTRHLVTVKVHKQKAVKKIST
jgi:hypothetical protein